MLDVHFGPIPGQQLIQPARRVALGHALEDVAEIGEGLDVVEFCGGDKGADGSPSLSAAVGAGEQMVLVAQRDRSDQPAWLLTTSDVRHFRITAEG